MYLKFRKFFDIKRSTVHLAPPVVRGLINLRGQIITAMDLRKRLGLPDRSEDEQPMNVVVRTEDEVVSLLVDEIGDVLEVSDQNFEPPLGTISEKMRDLIKGVYKLDAQLLLILDTVKVMEFESVS